MFKPWNLKNIMYEEEFFKYAELAGVKDTIIKNRDAIPQEVTLKRNAIKLLTKELEVTNKSLLNLAMKDKLSLIKSTLLKKLDALMWTWKTIRHSIT